MFSYKIVQSQCFECFILIAILLNGVKMVIDTYTVDYSTNSIEHRLGMIADVVFAVIFLADILLKTISFGFLFSDKAYLRSF